MNNLNVMSAAGWGEAPLKNEQDHGVKETGFDRALDNALQRRAGGTQEAEPTNSNGKGPESEADATMAIEESAQSTEHDCEDAAAPAVENEGEDTEMAGELEDQVAGIKVPPDGGAIATGGGAMLSQDVLSQTEGLLQSTAAGDAARPEPSAESHATGLQDSTPRIKGEASGGKVLDSLVAEPKNSPTQGETVAKPTLTPMEGDDPFSGPRPIVKLPEAGQMTGKTLGPAEADTSVKDGKLTQLRAPASAALAESDATEQIGREKTTGSMGAKAELVAQQLSELGDASAAARELRQSKTASITTRDTSRTPGHVDARGAGGHGGGSVEAQSLEAPLKQSFNPVANTGPQASGETSRTDAGERGATEEAPATGSSRMLEGVQFTGREAGAAELLPGRSDEGGPREMPPARIAARTLRLIENMRADGSRFQRALVRLDPPELGQMRIEVKLENDKLQARFVVENAVARERIMGELPRLREVLGAQGLEEARIEVHIEQGDKGLAEGGAEADGDETAPGDAERTGEKGAEQVRAARASLHQGLIDVRA